MCVCVIKCVCVSVCACVRTCMSRHSLTPSGDIHSPFHQVHCFVPIYHLYRDGFRQCWKWGMRPVMESPICEQHISLAFACFLDNSVNY